MLVARKALEIAAPARAIWAVLTGPASVRQWVAPLPFEGTINSTWEPGAAVSWDGDDGETYMRGAVLAAEPGTSLSFTVRDAAEEDEEDRAEDTMAATLEEKDGRTVLTLAYGDYDREHDTDDEHDHALQEEVCADMQERVLAGWLDGIRRLAEAAG